jgi:hypothetical protein
MSALTSTASQVAELNDRFRRNLSGGGLRVMTAGVASLPPDDQVAILARVTAFDAFTPENDPYGEHDFGSFEYAGDRIFWKIDTYADDSLTFGAEDPADPNAVRVLTIMLAEEY